MTIAMFSLIIFSLVMMATISENFTRAFLSDDAAAGWTVRADAGFSNPIDDFEGTLHGIRLCYGRATGYNTYGREGFPRGARLIELREGERAFSTWLRLEGGEVVTEQPEHDPSHHIDDAA